MSGGRCREAKKLLRAQLCLLLLLVPHILHYSLGTSFYLHEIGNDRVEQEQGNHPRSRSRVLVLCGKVPKSSVTTDQTSKSGGQVN